MRWRVFASAVPLPGRAEESTTTKAPPGRSAAKTARFMAARSVSSQTVS